MSRFFQIRFLLLFSIGLVIFVQPGQGSELESTRELLLPDDFQFSGMRQVFHKGSAAVPELINALDDPNEKGALNAQIMLRLLGDQRGILSLHEWYQRPKPDLKIVNGPVSIPLQNWDYIQIEQILSRPPEEWRERAVNYFLALTIDGSLRAQSFLKRFLIPAREHKASGMFSQIAGDVSQGPKKVSACKRGAPEQVVRQNAFFLTPKTRNTVTIRRLAYADGKRLVLFKVAQTFGDTFLVVLARKDDCWRFQSVALWSTN